MDKIQFRRDTLTNWASANPILAEGEIGYVLDDPNRYKMGDGIKTWDQLPFRGFDGTIVHELGENQTVVMSQDAVSREFASVETGLNVVNASQAEAYVSQNILINQNTNLIYNEKQTLQIKLSEIGGYVQKNGTVLAIENSYYWFCDVYDITNVTKIRIIGNGHNNTCLFAIYEDELYTKLLAKKTGNGQETITIDKPLGGKYLLCTRNHIGGYSSSVYSVDFSKIGLNLNNKLSYISSIEGYVNRGGVIVPVIGGGYHIRIFKVDNYTDINIIGIQPNGTYYGFFADENLTQPIIMFEKGRINAVDTTYNVPNGAGYFAISEYVSGGDIYTSNLYGIYSKKNNDILCIGDSITQGNYAIQQQSWMYYLQQIDELNTYINAGIGGQTTLQIAARASGIPAYINQNVEIPNNRNKVEIANYNIGLRSTDDSSIIFISEAKYDSGDGKGLYEFSKVNPCYIEGIEFALSNDGTIGEFNTPSLDFKLYINRTTTDPSLTALDEITIPQGSIISTYLGYKLMKSKGLIIWAGTNDSISDFSKLPDRISKIVAVYGKSNYIVIGPWICAHEGSQNTIPELKPAIQLQVKETNDQLRNKFGKNYLDMLNWGKMQAWKELDITLTELDNARISAGYLPSSITIDGVHPTIDLCQAIAQRIHRKFLSI